MVVTIEASTVNEGESGSQEMRNGRGVRAKMRLVFLTLRASLGVIATRLAIICVARVFGNVSE